MDGPVEIVCPTCRTPVRDKWWFSHFRQGSTELPCLDGCGQSFLVIRTGAEITTTAIHTVEPASQVWIGPPGE